MPCNGRQGKNIHEISWNICIPLNLAKHSETTTATFYHENNHKTSVSATETCMVDFAVISLPFLQEFATLLPLSGAQAFHLHRGISLTRAFDGGREMKRSSRFAAVGSKCARTHQKSRIVLFSAAVATAALSSAPLMPKAFATSSTWVSNPIDSSWSTTANWVSGIVPGNVNPAA